MYETPHLLKSHIDRLVQVHSSTAQAAKSDATRSKADIGIAPEQRNAIVCILNTINADEFLLYVKSRRFHWMVEGPHFSELHALFQKHYEALGVVIDDIAERARALDGIAAGSLQEYLELTRLHEAPAQQYDAAGMIAALLADHEAIVRNLRLDLQACLEQGDEGTTDFLTGLMQAHEKMAWMLRVHLR